MGIVVLIMVFMVKVNKLNGKEVILQMLNARRNRMKQIRYG